MCLFHVVPAYGINERWAMGGLIAAPIAAVAGLVLRWRAKYTTTVLVSMIACAGYLSIYVFGLLGPAAYLFLVRNSHLVPWIIPALGASLFAALAWRIKVSFRNDWSGPVEQGPGVRLIGNTLERIPPGDISGFTKGTAILTAGTGLVALVLRGHAFYTAAALAVLPLLVAVMLVDPLARLITFYQVFRRLERERGRRFDLPPLKRGGR